MCSKCQVFKPTYDFNHKLDTADGYRYECKACNVEIVKQWRENNRNHVNLQ